MSKQSSSEPGNIDQEAKAELEKLKELMGPVPEEARQEDFIVEDQLTISNSRQLDPTDAAIESIVVEESNTVLDIVDASQENVVSQKRNNSLKALFGSKKARVFLVVGMVLFVVAFISYPTTRYMVLNTVGAKASASVSVLDDTTGQPLRSVSVSIAGEEVKTDSNGIARFEDINLGKTTLNINKVAYAESTEPITIGWGSNPLGERSLVATGIQLSYRVSDWLTSKPVERAEISSGENSVYTDESGIAVLTIEDNDSETVNVSISKNGFRTEIQKKPINEKDRSEVVLVAAAPIVFFSKRDGTFDLYQIDADGKNEKLLVKGTGAEREDMTLAVSENNKHVAFVSSRSAKRNTDGFILDGLFLYDSQTNTPVEISNSEQIRIIGWVEDSVIFVKVKSGLSAADPAREQLLSYDASSKNSHLLGESNQFNDIALMGGKVIVAESNTYGENKDVSVYTIDANETNKQVVLNSQAWTLLRTSYDQLTMSSPNNTWYGYKTGAEKVEKIESPASVPRDRRYVTNPSEKKSTWFDYRDGKGVIVVWDVEQKKDTVLYSAGGLITPFRWLNDTYVVLRQSSLTETADYVISVEGGSPVKVVDVVDIDTDGNRNFY